MFTVALVVGSVRKESINKKLAKALEHIGSDLFTFVTLDLASLPMYNQDMESPPPAEVARMKSAIKAADAVLFITPEYNRSIPALLKNALDWGSRPYGQNSWSGKPTAIAGITAGATGTAVGQAHLRSVVTILNMPLMSQPEMYITDVPGMISEDGKIIADKTKVFFRSFLETFSKWIAHTK